MIWEPGAARPLSDDDKTKWDARIERAERTRKAHEPAWDNALKRYVDAKANKYDVNPLLDFRHVETKKSDLFYQTPEVQLHPIDPGNPEIQTEALLPIRQKVLNDRLGPDGTDVKRTVHEALFDALAPSGMLVTDIGYDVRMAPLPPAPAVEDVEAPPQPAEIPVWGKPFWARVSPKKALIPPEFTSTRFDEAPWLGIGPLTMPLKRAKREFDLPEDFNASTHRDDAVFKFEGTQEADGDPLVEYYKVWYRAEVFDESILNPELFRLLILVKGHDKAVKHIDSPFQTIDELGMLTPDSMRGNPIHIGTLRDLSDSAYIPSDLVMNEQLSNELGKFRTGLVRGRVARQPITAIDPDGFPEAEIDKLKAGEKVVFTKPGTLIAGQIAIQTANVGTEPRDNYTAQEMIERDSQLAMGTSDNRSGALAKQKRTATEVRAVESGASARAQAEKDRLREWFIAGVRKFDCVLQRTMTPRELTLILGSQGAALWDQWKGLPGCYVYKVLPDSGVHVDAQQFRAQQLDNYNLLRKDPLLNAPELLKPIIRSLGYDPAKAILPQQPEQGPEPIKSSIAFKGEDLIGPQSQAVVEILAQQGITISAGAIESLKMASLLVQSGMLQPNGQPMPIAEPGAKHPGSANKTEPVNQHARQTTGGVNGVGVQ